MTLCEPAELETLTLAMQTDASDELACADRLIDRYPEDPRLHFLRGSILAAIGRSIEAMAALKTAVEIAPDFAIARFQLGFFQLTSGEAVDALATWGPLALLPEGHYLRDFVGGLSHLIRDEFDAAIARLRDGIAANADNPPLNRDMQLIIDQVSALIRTNETTGPAPASATSFLLDQFPSNRRN